MDDSKTAAHNEIKLNTANNLSKVLLCPDQLDRLDCEETEHSRISAPEATSFVQEPKKLEKREPIGLGGLKFNTECSLSSIDKENSPDCSPHITIPSARASQTSPLKIVVYP